MTDVIAFDVELTENQKMAQHKLYQVHELYDEIEKLLGTQDVFNKPHMLLVLPNKLKKEPMTNEEWFCSLSTEEKATFLAIQIRLGVEFYRTNDERYQNHDWWVEWLKQPHTFE